jgi:hypothetical protein
MSMFSNPGNAGFNDFPPGPHAGVPTDPNAHVVPDPIDTGIRKALRSRWARPSAIVLVCVVVAIGVFMSLH